MNNLALGFAAIFFVPALGADYLEPEPPTYLAIAEKSVDLKEAFGPAVMARMIVEPSFQYSYAVLLEQKQDRNFIVSLKFPPDVENTLQRYEEIERLKREPPNNDLKQAAEIIALLRKDLPPYPKDAKPERCEVEIDAVFTTKLVEAWKSLLSDVQRQPYSGGLDGEFYHFALRFDGKMLMGQVWSPSLTSRPGRLIKIGEMMREFCQSRRDNIIAEAERIIER